MIASLRGIIIAAEPGVAIVEVNGVGYRLLLAPGAHERLPAGGQTVMFHTHLHVQEDALNLYGFHDGQQLEFFKLLLKVSGIGPRLALGLVGAISPQDFYADLVAGNVAGLVRLPGIGRKTAQRILLELREKVTDMQLVDPESQVVGSELETAGCDALTALGYTQAEAQEAVRQAIRSLDVDAPEVQEVVEEGLRYLVRR